MQHRSKTTSNLGEELFDLAFLHGQWSQATFGPDGNGPGQRGPKGPLEHMAKEVREALKSPQDINERADMLLLLLDANRRAGDDVFDLVRAAANKLEANRARQWPPIDPANLNGAVEHVKPKRPRGRPRKHPLPTETVIAKTGPATLGTTPTTLDLTGPPIDCGYEATHPTTLAQNPNANLVPLPDRPDLKIFTASEEADRPDLKIFDPQPESPNDTGLTNSGLSGP